MTFVKPRDDKVREDQMLLTHEYLAEKRILFLYGVMMGMASIPMGRSDAWGPDYVADTMLALSLESQDPIYLVIDSEGGSVRDGFSVYDTIKSIGAPVYTVGRNCLSMAAILLAAGEAGHRYIFPNGKIMLHLPSGGYSGDAKDIEIQSAEMKRIKEEIIAVLQQNGVKAPADKILQDIDRAYWMTPTAAIEYGLADRIVPKGFFDALRNVPYVPKM